MQLLSNSYGHKSEFILSNLQGTGKILYIANHGHMITRQGNATNVNANTNLNATL